MEKSTSSLIPDILKIALIFLIAVILVSVSLYILMLTAIKGDEVEVPNVIGKSFLEAFEILSENNLRIRKMDVRKHSEGLPENYVVEQRPMPGDKVKSGRKISIILSRGAEEGTVPRVVEKFVPEAESLIKSAGLEVGNVVRVHSNDFPQEGVIIAHTPPPNATVQRDSKVNLLVSLGPHSVQLIMPDLRGMELQAVSKLLETKQLKLGLVTRKASSDKADVVLDQVPQPNERIGTGAAVDVVVSSGELSEAVLRGVVLRYAVPRRPKPTPTGDPPYAPPEDLSDRSVRIVLEHEGKTRTIVEKNFPPDKLLEYFLQVKGQGIAKIYVDDMLAEVMICTWPSTEFVPR